MITEIGNWEMQPPAAVRPAGRPPAACERHPDEPVTGFCASCLRERLAGLEATNSDEAPPRKSTSSAIKSIFSRSSGVQSNSNLQSSSFRRSELRRSKSFSVSRFPCVAAAACEPQRRSCDVRARNTLLALFHQDDVDRPAVSFSGEECRKFPLPGKEGGDDTDEIMSAADDMEEDTETAVVEEEEEEFKSMKDHIDLNSQEKKTPAAKEFTGSFWFAASVFSKKLRNWRIQKLKKKSISSMQPEKTGSSSRRVRDTQSEIAVDAFGRRSFDINPRFSLDASRFSFEDPRQSWDEPRASWDGYVAAGGGIGRSVLPRLPPMLAVAEDFPAPAVQRFDGLIPVVEDLVMPGGSLQTLDYYEGSTSRGRRSLERSNSTRKSSFEMKAVTPGPNGYPRGSMSAELVQTYHGGKHERDSREWSSNSLRDECSENLDFTSRDQSKVPPAKKSRRWSKAWSLFGFIHWRGRSSSTNSRGNGMERSFSETWPELRTSGYTPQICRSNSMASSRGPFKGNGERNGLQGKGNRKKKKIVEEFELERNSSSRYSSTRDVDNGLSGLYLPAMKGSRRKSGKYISSHAITGSMLSLY